MPLSTTTQILGRRNNPQSRFPAWVESGTFQKNKTNYSWILKREHQGTDKHVSKEYQIIDIFNLSLHVSLKQWCPPESIFTTLGYPIHSPGIKYHLYPDDSFIQPRTHSYAPDPVYLTAWWYGPLDVLQASRNTSTKLNLESLPNLFLLLNLHPITEQHWPSTPIVLTPLINNPLYPTCPPHF